MSGRLFHESLYRFNEPQPSWWEASIDDKPNPGVQLENDVFHEIAVIGGGYTGISAALHLAREFDRDVCVLEAGHIGWGASGRNGGFCTMGGTMLGTSTLIRKFGMEETRSFYRCQKEAVELVRTLADECPVDVERQQEGEMVVAERPDHFDMLEKECALQKTLGIDVSMIPKEEFGARYYNAPHQNGAMLQKPGFGLHPLKFLLGLASIAEREGVTLYPNSEIISWSKEGGRHVLRSERGFVRCNAVIVACNGFMPETLNSGLSGRTLPLQSQIIVTEPLQDEQLAAHEWQTGVPAINSRHVYHYFRMLPGNRFLFGGRGDFTGSPKGADKSKQALKKSLAELWPDWRDVEIDYTWRGFVCFTRELRPAVGRLPEDGSVYFGFGYHGNGVNNATWIGREIARWLATGSNSGDPVPRHLPAAMQGLTPAFPLPAFRKLYASAGIGWQRLRDRLENIR